MIEKVGRYLKFLFLKYYQAFDKRKFRAFVTSHTSYPMA